MSNRRKPRLVLPTEDQPLAPDATGVPWTDQPPANYSPATLNWIAARAGEAGRMNVWQCEECGERVLCYDLHPGVTPFTVSHKSLGAADCAGTCVSHFYSGVDAAVARAHGEPTHEWYRPSRKVLRGVSPWVRDHVMQGGLLVREVAS